jgi:hypothetical protein
MGIKKIKSQIYPFTPTFTVLPITIRNGYRFEIMFCGGSVASLAQTSKDASKQCWKIAPSESNPVWTRLDDMPHGRVMPDSVILPGNYILNKDETILFVNGAEYGTAGGNAGETLYTMNPVYHADVFDPNAPPAQQWKTLASAKILRLYHSEAILVQTGHVITTGSEMMNYDDYWGGGDAKCYPRGNEACTDPFNYRMERFSPPYMQKAQRLGRIKITEAPSSIDYDSEFEFKIEGDGNKVKKVTIVRYSTVTHSTNTDQRLIELAILERKGTTVRVRSPWNSAMAPPGNWMLWALDDQNVPSESVTILLTISNPPKFNFAFKDPHGPPPINSSTDMKTVYSLFSGILVAVLITFF